MNGIVTNPTETDIKNACKEFDGNEKNNPDPALTKLFTQYPRNTDFNIVLLKVVTLNTLYPTRIRVTSNRPTVYEVAAHIVELKIDDMLDCASDNLVHEIADTEELARLLGKIKQYNYSFATKYCSWHKPNCYPIWDSRVDAYLWYLRERGFIDSFKHQELKSYPKFKKIVTSFRCRNRLEKFTYKEIDKFIWLNGGKLLTAREAAKENKKQEAV